MLLACRDIFKQITYDCRYGVKHYTMYLGVFGYWYSRSFRSQRYFVFNQNIHIEKE